MAAQAGDDAAAAARDIDALDDGSGAVVDDGARQDDGLAGRGAARLAAVGEQRVGVGREHVVVEGGTVGGPGLSAVDLAVAVDGDGALVIDGGARLARGIAAAAGDALVDLDQLAGGRAGAHGVFVDVDADHGAPLAAPPTVGAGVDRDAERGAQQRVFVLDDDVAVVVARADGDEERDDVVDGDGLGADASDVEVDDVTLLHASDDDLEVGAVDEALGAGQAAADDERDEQGAANHGASSSSPARTKRPTPARALPTATAPATVAVVRQASTVRACSGSMVALCA